MSDRIEESPMHSVRTVLVLAAFALAAGCQQAPDKLDYLYNEMRLAEYGFRVVKVVDSSTFVIDWRGLGNAADFIRIKLVGLSTPSAVEFKELGGRKAGTYLHRLLKGKRVQVYIDTHGWYRPLLPKGHHSMFRLSTLYKALGHIPAFVWIARDLRRDESGQIREAFVNRLMLENGLSRVNRRYHFRREEDRGAFLLYENSARERRLGLWR